MFGCSWDDSTANRQSEWNEPSSEHEWDDFPSINTRAHRTRYERQNVQRLARTSESDGLVYESNFIIIMTVVVPLGLNKGGWMCVRVSAAAGRSTHVIVNDFGIWFGLICAENKKQPEVPHKWMETKRLLSSHTHHSEVVNGASSNRSDFKSARSCARTIHRSWVSNMSCDSRHSRSLHNKKLIK